MGNPRDDLRDYVDRQSYRGATQGEASRAVGGSFAQLAAAWAMLSSLGRIVHTGQYRQVDGRTERVYTAGPELAEVMQRYSPDQPRDDHGRWTTGGGGGDGGAGGGGGGGLDASGAESLIQAIHDNGGFTFDPRTGGLVKVGSVKGVAVAVPGTEQIIGRGAKVDRAEFISGVADVVQKHGDRLSKGAVLGGWFSEERKAYMVEITDVIPNRAKAIKLGRERNQEGVFDLGTGEYIPTGGTGG